MWMCCSRCTEGWGMMSSTFTCQEGAEDGMLERRAIILA
jgi:hypothetical protein